MAKIDTERLLILTVKRELENRRKIGGSIIPDLFCVLFLFLFVLLPFFLGFLISQNLRR